MIYARYKNCSFWKWELQLSKHACKIYSNYSKLCVISVFVKKVHFVPPKHASRCFSNEFSQRYWQESFDRDPFASQSRFDAYAPCPTVASASLARGRGFGKCFWGQVPRTLLSSCSSSATQIFLRLELLSSCVPF